MPPSRLADFELVIGDTPIPGAPAVTGHEVHVTSPAGPGTAVMGLITDRLKNLVSAASGDGPTLELRREAGKELFTWLFTGEVGKRWHGSLGMFVLGGFDVLRVRLWFRDPALAALPWEVLYDENRFLATDARLTISRYLPCPEPSYLDPVSKVRILVVINRPRLGTAFPEITDHTAAGLISMFDQFRRVHYKLLDNPELTTIQKELEDGYHVLHYLGHGMGDELIFTNLDGSPGSIKVENLSQILIGRKALRVVVLNACGSAQFGIQDVFGGVGPGVVKAGVPAAIAMQYNHVTSEMATRFNLTFYDRLSDGYPIDMCVTAARQAVSAKDVADRGWSTPVLYLGTRREHVIELTPEARAANSPLPAEFRSPSGNTNTTAATPAIPAGSGESNAGCAPAQPRIPTGSGDHRKRLWRGLAALVVILAMATIGLRQCWPEDTPTRPSSGGNADGLHQLAGPAPPPKVGDDPPELPDLKIHSVTLDKSKGNAGEVLQVFIKLSHPPLADGEIVVPEFSKKSGFSPDDQFHPQKIPELVAGDPPELVCAFNAAAPGSAWVRLIRQNAQGVVTGKSRPFPFP